MVFTVVLFVVVVGCTLVVGIAPEGTEDDSVVDISITQGATSKDQRYSFELPVIPAFSSSMLGWHDV